MPLLYLYDQCLQLMELKSSNRLSLDVWSELRDDVNDALRGECTSVELAALADTCRRHAVPKQFLFDMLDGVDYWIRFQQFESFDELGVFAYRMGGAPLVASVSILGFERPGYEVPAIRLGKAFFLTHLLSQACTQARANRILFAQDDLKATELDLQRFKLRQPSRALNHLVRLYARRILDRLREGSELLAYLEFDANRTMRSMIAAHWTMVTEMQRDPAAVFQPERLLSGKPLWSLRLRHLLGLEGNVPWLAETNGPGH